METRASRGLLVKGIGYGKSKKKGSKKKKR